MRRSYSIQWRRPSRRTIALTVVAVFVSIFVGTGYAVHTVMSGPAMGTVVDNLAAVSRPVPVELQQFDGKYFSFVHPMTYIDQKSKPDPSSLESQMFVSSGMMRKIITATITNLPSGKLEDDSSYAMRLQNPDKYKIKYVVIKNERVAIATAKSSQEFQQTAFWPHDGKLLLFSMTGVSVEPAAMAVEHETMVRSFSWR